MGQQNNNNNYQNNNRTRNNYFKNEIKRNGPQFLARKNPTELKRDFVRIMRELALGKIEIPSEGIYICNRDLLEAGRVIYNTKILYYSTLRVAMQEHVKNIEMNMGACPQEVMAILVEQQKFETAWSIIRNSLESLAMNSDYIGVLTCMANQLYQYRNNI